MIVPQFLFVAAAWCLVTSTSLGVGVRNSIECSIDEQCKENEFCSVRSHQCTPCRTCSGIGRLPARGSKCAKQKSECGECMPGYQDGSSGDFCVEKMTEPPRLKHSNNQSDEYMYNNMTSTSLPPWLVLLVVAFIATPCTVLLVYVAKRKLSFGHSGPNLRRAEQVALSNVSICRDSEKAALSPLTCNSSETECRPSAPFEDNQRQPPYNIYYSDISDRDGGRQRAVSGPEAAVRAKFFRDESRKQQAMPYSYGNGSGQWTVLAPLEMNGNPQPANQIEPMDVQPPSPDQPDAPIAPLPVNNIPHEFIEEMLVDEFGAGDEVQAAGGAEYPGVYLNIHIGYGLFMSRSENNVNTVAVDEAPGWMIQTQMDVLNPLTESQDSGIASAQEDPVQVPDISYRSVTSSQVDEMMEEEES